MYKLEKNVDTNKYVAVNTMKGIYSYCIPLVSGNSDYAEFKRKIFAEEAELQDADGNVMSAEEAKAYIATLPA